MTDKEVHKLKRAELLEILVEQKKEIARLKKRLKAAEEKLESRDILIRQAGSIAEASLQLNHIFEDAQNAADQYLENIRRLYPECRDYTGKGSSRSHERSPEQKERAEKKE